VAMMFQNNYPQEIYQGLGKF